MEVAVTFFRHVLSTLSSGDAASPAAAVTAAHAHVLKGGQAASQHVYGLALRMLCNTDLASAKTQTDTVSVVERYVRVAIACMAPGVGLVEDTVPFLLLEDAFDASVIAHCEALWSILEAHKSLLATIASRPQARFRMPLLRIATSLMRRLSRAQHTIFLGRILISLAYMFPLTDRSGVNAYGAFNTENVTAYDGVEADEALIAEAKKATQALPVPVGTEAAGRLDELSRVLTPLKSVPHSPAGVEHLLAAHHDVVTGRSAEGDHFYRTFWRLQQYVTVPSRATATAETWALFVATLHILLFAYERADATAAASTQRNPAAGTSGLGAASAGGGAHSTNATSGGSDRRGGMVAAAEATRTPRMTRRRTSSVGSSDAASRSAAVEGVAAEQGGGGGMSVKYLTHRRLFALELSDATLRLNVLLQCSVLLAYLQMQKSEADAYAASLVTSTSASAPVTAAGDKGAKSTSAGTPTAAAGTPTAAGAVASTASASTPTAAAGAAGAVKKPREPIAPGLPMAEEIALLLARIEPLVRNTPPHGAEYAQAFHMLLARDSQWRSWKNVGAPDFVKQLPDAAALAVVAGADDAASTGPDSTAAGQKRHAAGTSVGGARPWKRPRIMLSRPANWASAGVNADLMSVCATRATSIRHFTPEAVMSPMLLALDESQGIEREYWPSTDEVYAWRAYRVLVASRLAELHAANATSYVSLICKLHNLVDPTATAPSSPIVEDEAMHDGGQEPEEDVEQSEGKGEGEEAAIPEDTEPLSTEALMHAQQTDDAEAERVNNESSPLASSAKHDEDASMVSESPSAPEGAPDTAAPPTSESRSEGEEGEASDGEVPA